MERGRDTKGKNDDEEEDEDELKGEKYTINKTEREKYEKKKNHSCVDRKTGSQASTIRGSKCAFAEVQIGTCSLTAD